MKPLQLDVPPSQPPRELRLSQLNGGLSIKYFESLIKDNQSPQMQNLNADDRGSLSKRWGIIKTYETSLGSGSINGIYYYASKIVIAWGTQVYTQSGGDQPVSIYSGIANTKATFFEFNNILYLVNGTDYIAYNGTTCTTVTPYVPLLYTGRLYSGGGTAYEGINRIGAGFKNSFNGDASHTSFLLSQTELDATLVTVTISGVAKTEGTHFTVNRTTGTVDFTGGTSPHGAPATGTDNVIITAYKTDSTAVTSIKSCKYVASYGGENDTRIFLCGYGNYVFYSGLLDPTYFPYNNYNRLGDPNKTCNGFSKIYDILVVFKDKSIYSMEYLNNSGTVSFPTKVINDAVGCDIPGSIQLINDNPVWCNTYRGVYILWTNGSIKEEKNVRLISDNINGSPYKTGILDETSENLLLASSFDFEGKYYLCIATKCWLWDYKISPYQGLTDGGESLSWFYYTNINASCWINNGTDLYFGDRTNGVVNKANSGVYNDNGTAINGIWRSKLFAFDDGSGNQLTDWYKTIIEFWLTTRSNINADVNITYYSEIGSTLETTTISAASVKNFDWSHWDWSNYTWNVVNYAATIRKKPKLKKIKYFQIELANNEINQNLSIIYLVISYILSQRVK
jgi:hypothetical protein